MKKAILVLFFISSISSAARLEDVKILEFASGQDSFELKLKTKDGAANSYFFVDIVKTDPNSFEKLVHVINKLSQRDSYKLDLNIISFSPSPSGSYYSSESVIFSGPANREPNYINPSKKKKNVK